MKEDDFMPAIQATCWNAQFDGSPDLWGGQEGLFPNQSRVEQVSIESLYMFTIVHNTFTHSYYKPENQWYLDENVMTFTYPQDYLMQDGSTVTVDYNNGLVLTQVYP